jgi:hypothetical protein
VIGNEVNRPERNELSPTEIIDAMKVARVAKGNSEFAELAFNVTTCFSGTVLKVQEKNSDGTYYKWKPDDWIPVVKACDHPVYLTVYPWYGQMWDPQKKEFTPDNIDAQMKWSWENGLSQVQDMDKQIVIAEIGWPSHSFEESTDPNPEKQREKARIMRGTTPENERINFERTKTYLSQVRPLPAFWFDMFDEPGKYAPDRPWESHWGLADKDAVAKWEWKRN